MKLKGLSLFSGIGGIELGLREYVKTTCYVEKDKYAQAVLKSRMSEGLLDNADIYNDITKFNGKKWKGKIDIVTGGFPCQDISNAGKRNGIYGKQSGLWFEMQRIIGEVRPKFVFVENVSALLVRGFDIVLGTLSEIGYDAVWTTLQASDVGAPHRRERLFLLAYTINSINNKQEQEKPREKRATQIKFWENDYWTRESWRTSNVGGKREKTNKNKTNNKKEFEVVNTFKFGWNSNKNKYKKFRQALQKETTIKYDRTSGKLRVVSWRQDPANQRPSSKSYVGRMVDGVPFRLDRIKCLGNAVVPQQGKKAFEILMDTIIDNKLK